MPSDTDIELLRERRRAPGQVLDAGEAPVRAATLEQRLVAIAFAEQVGAALTGSHPIDLCTNRGQGRDDELASCPAPACRLSQRRRWICRCMRSVKNAHRLHGCRMGAARARFQGVH